MRLTTRGELAEMLSISRPSVSLLAEAGVITGKTKAGKDIIFPTEEAERIAQVPYVESSHPPALVVKVRAAVDDRENGRAWRGWKPGIPADDNDQRDGVRQWWPVSDPDRYMGESLVVACAGFVLAVYRIDGYKLLPGGLKAFDVSTAESEKAVFFRGRRFPTLAGGMIELR